MPELKPRKLDGLRSTGCYINLFDEPQDFAVALLKCRVHGTNADTRRSASVSETSQVSDTHGRVASFELKRPYFATLPRLLPLPRAA